jgi:hypothetical protein
VLSVKHKTGLLHALVLAAAVMAASCSTIQSMMPGHKAAEERATALQELQLKVMRFADEYTGRIFEPIENFLVNSKSPEARLKAQNWRLSQSTSAYTIASGPNPITNALDMVVLATLSRMVMEDAWTKERYGEQATPLLEAHKALEPQAWAMLDSVLTAEQIQQLHGVIDKWREDHPNVRAVAYIHFRDFAKSIGRPRREEEYSSGSLFALLGLDPLSNLDPAVRELAQTRQLAERTIYYVQRMPNLLDMQIERLTYQFAVMPETQDLLLNADRISLAAEAAGHLPQVVASEREAAINQFMSALNAEQSQMRSLVTELKGALEAGSETSDSLTTTIRSLDAFVARFDKPKQRPPGAPPGRPFDINDYAATARDLAGAAQQLQALIVQLDSSSTGVERLTASAAGDLRAVVDHAYWRAVELILILVAAILAAALIYRFASRRLLAGRPR